MEKFSRLKTQRTLNQTAQDIVTLEAAIKAAQQNAKEARKTVRNLKKQTEALKRFATDNKHHVLINPKSNKFTLVKN